jgi:hypothetical protein
MRFEPFENTTNFLEDMGMFEAAVQPTQVELSIPQLRSVLVVLDGSAQEPTAQQIGARIAKSHQCFRRDHGGCVGGGKHHSAGAANQRKPGGNPPPIWL